MITDELLIKLLDRDEEKKDVLWAQKMVSLLMRNAVPIITKSEYELRRNVIRGHFPDAHLDNIFVGDTMSALKDRLTKQNTVFFFERIRNSIIDERTNADLTITINSLDPQKQDKKQYDKTLLKNRKGIENLVNEVTGNNGMPPVKYKADDYNGNVSDFDAKGGDEFDPTELDDFFDRAWGLKDEWAYQNIVNHVFQENEVVNTYDKKIDDILICLHNFSRVYIDAFDGSQKIKVLKPYEPWVLHSTGSNNYKDAQGWTIPMDTNVRGFMRMFGTHFNFENDWTYLLSAAYGGKKITYSGISEGGFIDPQSKQRVNARLRYGVMGNLIDFEDFCDLPLKYRYSEWKTITGIASVKAVTPEGNIINLRVSPNDERVDGADSEVREQEDTYYAYSLDYNSMTPKIIKYGKVYMQEFEGLNDEYSGFTIKATKRDGVPIAEILKPFYFMINVLFKMLEMLVNDIKPDGYLVNYSAMIRIANELSKSPDAPVDIKKGVDMFLAMMQNSPNIVMDTPKGEGGEVLGGGTSSLIPNKKGLNDSSVDITKVFDWAEQKAALYTGTQGLDLATNDDGFKVSIERKKRSRAATSFIDFIMLDHFKDCAITILNYSQDIVKFKDIPAYKWLECAVGFKIMDYLNTKDKSPHRYGTFVQTFNNDISLLEMKQAASVALEREQISFEQYLVVTAFKNPIQAAMYLAYEKKKAEQKAQQDYYAKLKGTDALAEKQAQREIELENVKGKWRALAEDKRAAGFITASQQNSQAQIQAKVIQERGQDERLAATAVNDINKIAQEATKNAQKPVE